MSKRPLPDCTACGVCCRAPPNQMAWADIYEDDLARLTPYFIRKHVRRRTAFQMLVEELTLRPSYFTVDAIHTKGNHNGTVCVALRGTIGKRCSCSIYARRPDVCRNFEPGCPSCLRARRIYLKETND